jgi:hypothetical protein
MPLALALKFCSSCLFSAGITGMHHNTWP